jgi:hypothetical protein
MHLNYATSDTQPFWGTASGTFQVASRFLFRGTTALGTPTAFKVVARKTVSTGGNVFDVQLVDQTSGLVVATIAAGTVTTTFAIYSTTALSNLPTGETILVIEAREAGNGDFEMASAHILF